MVENLWSSLRAVLKVLEESHNKTVFPWNSYYQEPVDTDETPGTMPINALSLMKGTLVNVSLHCHNRQMWPLYTMVIYNIEPDDC